MAFSGLTLTGKKAIVTGAATGIGKEAARSLIERGVEVVIADRDREHGEQAAASLGCAFICTDVRSAQDVDKLLRGAADTLGGIDILVNAARYACSASAFDISAEEWQECVDTNLSAVFFVSRAAALYMKEAGKGSIINVTYSDAARVSWADTRSALNAAASGVVMLTKSLAAEWARYGIRVNAIVTGAREGNDTSGDDAGLVRAEEQLRFTPAGRFARPEDFAGAVVYLASDASSYTTGHAMVVDGGHYAY